MQLARSGPIQLAKGGPIYLARTRSSGPMQLAGDNSAGESTGGTDGAPLTGVETRPAPAGEGRAAVELLPAGGLGRAVDVAARDTTEGRRDPREKLAR